MVAITRSIPIASTMHLAFIISLTETCFGGQFVAYEAAADKLFKGTDRVYESNHYDRNLDDIG